MDDQHACGAPHRANLVLVGPAAVVRHRPPAERVRIELARPGGIGHGRIVDQHDERLALHVDALVVVPVEFGCDDAVADEDEVRLVDARGVGDMLRPRNHVVFPLERELTRALREHQRRGRRSDADERHLLNVAAVGVARLEADLLELIDQVGHGQRLAPGARRAPFELVGRQRFRVRHHLADVHVGQLRERRRATGALLRAGDCHRRRHQHGRQHSWCLHAAHSCILCKMPLQRRHAWPAAIAVAAMAAVPQWAAAQARNMTLTAVPGIKVGHHTIAERPTGCTVILLEAGATAGVDVRGAAPATAETDLLKPGESRAADLRHQPFRRQRIRPRRADRRHAVSRRKEHRLQGVSATINVPIVPAASLIDLNVGGNPKIRPTADCGYRAAQTASTAPVAEGNVGAGAGATVGKSCRREPRDERRHRQRGHPHARRPHRGRARRRQRRRRHRRSGHGESRRRRCVRQTASRSPMRACCCASGALRQPARIGENTTLGVVATNATLTKTQATKVAEMAHDGFARAIVSEPHDGRRRHDLRDRHRRRRRARRTSAASARLPHRSMADAIVRAARQATGIPGYPAARDLKDITWGGPFRAAGMNLHLLVLIVYSLALMAFGAWIGRRVRGAGDFFVAGRQLGPGLHLRDDARRQHRRGIDRRRDGARIRGRSRRVVVGRVGRDRIDRARDVDWTGDAPRGGSARTAHRRRLPRVSLQPRRSGDHRGASLGRIACSFSRDSCSAIGSILSTVAGATPWVGCVDRRRGRSPSYFAAGGLLTSAWVNVVQLTVKMVGFAHRAAARACRGRLGRATSGRVATRPDLLDSSGAPARPACRTSRCSCRRSSCRRGCCRRSSARATIAPCVSASA